MSAKELLFQLYQKFYEQRSVLTGAPVLTIDTSTTSIDAFDTDLADKEITKLISYLLGTQDVGQLPWNDALALVEKYYASQPQWQKLLLDYFSYTLEKEKESIIKEQASFFQEILEQLETQNSQSKIQPNNNP